MMANLSLSPNLTPQQPDYNQANYNYQWKQVQSALDALPATFVSSIDFSSSASGALTFAGYIVTQGGVGNQTFTFDLSGGIVTTYQEYTDPTSNVDVTAFCSYLVSNAHSVSFALPPASDNLGRIYSVNTLGNTAVPVVAQNGTDTIESNEGRGHVFYMSNGVNTWRNIMSINTP